ncbi:MAG: NifB/NifX family molybdenum-iron cluster-binding protein [Kiritimatiellae bacterium]|nr:NifB/NifX family molybdenum-iron cluster-binding protein [Kiritimatiellia bacterium]
MKVAIPAEGPTLESAAGRRFGIAPYLIVADPATGAFEPIPNPGASAARGAGMQALVVVLDKDVKAVLTRHCSPAVVSHLEAHGVRTVSGLVGTVGEILERYRNNEIGDAGEGVITGTRPHMGLFAPSAWQAAVRQSCRELGAMFPVLAGVVLLIGLLRAFVPTTVLGSLFSGNAIRDTLCGACAGSILAGNPINSYVIGSELLKHGVSLFAVTALILAWVTVGVVQLPAEMAALGRKFAILRNAVCFLLAPPIAVVTVVLLHMVTGAAP